MRSTALTGPICALVIGASSLAHADGLRCDNKLLSTGDTKYDARSLCGAPDAEEHRVEKRTIRQNISVPCADSRRARCASAIEQSVEVSIDTWTYDFGPQRFVQYVIFEDDKVVKIVSGNYGHKKQ